MGEYSFASWLACLQVLKLITLQQNIINYGPAEHTFFREREDAPTRKRWRCKAVRGGGVGGVCFCSVPAISDVFCGFCRISHIQIPTFAYEAVNSKAKGVGLCGGGGGWPVFLHLLRLLCLSLSVSIDFLLSGPVFVCLKTIQ